MFIRCTFEEIEARRKVAKTFTTDSSPAPIFIKGLITLKDHFRVRKFYVNENLESVSVTH